MNPNDYNTNLPATSNKANSVELLNQTKRLRPNIPKASASQLCLLVLDASGSMNNLHYGGQTKADAVKEASLGLITRFKQSSKRANFHLGILNFDHRVIIRQEPTPVMSMKNDIVLIMNDLGARTDIGNALLKAYEICTAFLAEEQSGGLPHSTVILIMSDGFCDKPEETIAIAEDIKQKHTLRKLKIATSIFGIKNHDTEAEKAIELLKNVASLNEDGTPCFQQTDSVEALRNFFIVSSGVA